MEEIQYEPHTINRNHLDMAAYNAKYVQCKKYLAGDKSLMKPLLNDITTFSYLFFKLNNKPVVMYPYQDMILNTNAKYKIFRAARQIGKSICLDVKSAYNLCLDHGHEHNECIISKSLPQATFQMSRVKHLLNTARFNWREQKGPQDSMSVITVSIYDELDDSYEKENRPRRVKYVNRLVVAPCTEGALGYDFHEVNLDEFEYWDVDCNNFYNNVIEPTIYTTKGNICIFSNPNGADSYAAELELQRLPSGDLKWKTFCFNFMDRPGATKEDFEMHIVGKTRQQIESQLLAVRSLSDRNYFSPDEIERSYDSFLNELKMIGKQPFFALDVGSKHDQSVLVGGFVEPDDSGRFMRLYMPIIHLYPVGYPLSRVVGSNVDDSDGWGHVKSVKEFLDEYSENGIIPVFGVDCTGNSGIVPLFEAAGIYPQDITLSGPVKSGMYQRFKYFMEKGLLHRIKSSEFEYQARHLEVKKSQRGYLMIHHENENDLDDVMDATAMLISLADSPDIVPVSVEVF